MVTMYFGKYTQGCGFVGTSENAADDLVKALRMAGERFDETSLRETPRINESPKAGDPIPEVLWGLNRDELSQLPPEMIGRLPTELFCKLPPGTVANLPASVLAPLASRLAKEQLQAAWAATRNAA